MSWMSETRSSIQKALEQATELDLSDISLEIPPDQSMGDFAFPCFALAKTYKKSPAAIAEDLSCSVSSLPQHHHMIEKVEANGPYLNFFLATEGIAQQVLGEIWSQGEAYGSKKGDEDCVLIESPSPNTNKPLHLGHLRNMLLGASLRNVLKFQGKDARIVNMVNDRGVHICKSMLAYERFGNGETPDTAGRKPDHFVGDYYVTFSEAVKDNPELEQEAQDMLVRWEQGDEHVVALWRQMTDWANEGFSQTYEKLDFTIDKEYHESEIYTEGKRIVRDGLQTGAFQQDEHGAIVVDLNERNLGTKVLLRSDGTAVYITQDVYLAKLRYEDYGFDRMIYVVGNEQDYHFKVLFEIFRLLGYPFSEDCVHFAYGMVELPEGKMKSREGTVVDTDDLIEEVRMMTQQELAQRYPDLSRAELHRRCDAIALGAIRFFILKFDPLKDMVYQPQESISFDGETGPYVQYTHARLCSILRKEQYTGGSIQYTELENAKHIVKHLGAFPDTVQKAVDKLNPAVLSRYLLELSQAMNEFYHKYQVLHEDEATRRARLYLVGCVRQVLATGLSLLEITPLERM